MVKVQSSSPKVGSSAKGASPGGTEQSGPGAPPTRKEPLTKEEQVKKVKRTVGWYNKYGGLKQPIIYKSAGSSLEKLKTGKALKILNDLEEKADTIRNPTAWVKRAAENAAPELAPSVRKVIGWYNKNGGLQEPIKYTEIAPLFAQLDTPSALQILSSLEGKASEVKNPTGWLSKAAKKYAAEGWGTMGVDWAWGPNSGEFAGEVDAKVRKVIGWYNKQGKLQDKIRFDEVAPFFAQIGTGEALKILSTLEGKEGQVKNPTAWLCGAAQKRGAGSSEGDEWMVASGSKGGWSTAGDVDTVVRKNIGWYNKKGNLLEQIRYSELAPLFAQLDLDSTVQILNSFEGRESSVKNPTAWFTKAVNNMLSSSF